MAEKLNGNLTGIKGTMLERIKSIYELKMGLDEFASSELINLLSECSGEINREISVYIARDGSIADVSIGDSSRVSMPSMRLVRNEDRLCGVRCIHTHPNGDGRLSDVDIGTLRSSKLDAMAALGVLDGKPTQLYCAYLGELSEDTGCREAIVYGPLRPNKLPQQALIGEIYASDDRFRSTTKAVEEAEAERAVLVGMDNDEGYDTLKELGDLAETAGALVVETVRIRRRPIDNATYIGSGKAEELGLKCSALEAELVIFDDELSALQLRSLEQILGTRVIDRTTLILDIFAGRATSREGKLQVELAQMRYMLPRLLGQGSSLSRLGGGIGTRGPGEKKLEIDRRRIRRRIFELENDLMEVEKQRGLRRETRKANRIPLVALVGYTNAGKSTMLNALTSSDVYAADKLFATLDPVVRQITLENGSEALISDTVGFINKLPHDLVSAFKSTLEEVANADLILHVVDISCPFYDKQMQVVEDVLSSLNASNIPKVTVFNKCDKLSDARPAESGNFDAESADGPAGSKSPDPGSLISAFESSGKSAAVVSAKRGDGIQQLLSIIEQKLSSHRREIELIVPYSRYEVMSFIRDKGMLLDEEHLEGGTKVRALLDEADIGQLRKMLKMDF